MKTEAPIVITVKTTVDAPVDKVWEYWTGPEHITKWCQASDDWHAPHAENDPRKGGKFKTTMAAKDASAQFDFEGEYSEVIKHQLIEYAMSDGRRVKVEFIPQNNTTQIVESFDAENVNSIELQQGGWQAILDNFRKYTESH